MSKSILFQGDSITDCGRSREYDDMTGNDYPTMVKGGTMNIFDVHVHAYNTEPDPEELIRRLDAAGVFGCCIFSTRPLEFNPEIGASFEDRMNELLAWTSGYEDRLFPVLWIHPDEEDLCTKIHVAADRGICAFKMICNNFYVYEERVLALLREIAVLNLPIFFHSGILWDGEVSSQYNRPLNWESLLKIEGLRFSMGHCSWPWIDECVALYGKFLNALTKRNTAEMFFDITPGTPTIYREELLTKLYTIGYDVGDNILFGSDCRANSYNSRWTEEWLEVDRKILDKLGVSCENREKLYAANLMRFLGKTDVTAHKKSPVPDNSNAWSPENEEVKSVIEKWYKLLEFPGYYDDEFYEALHTIKISDAISIKTYDVSEKDGKRNLLSFLYFCEQLEKEYEMRGLSKEILMDTLSDIRVWCEIWSEMKGELYLGELKWLKRIMDVKLFKLGSLEFCLGAADCDTASLGLSQGDPVIEVHIPNGTDLSQNQCRASLEMAKVFFEKYFPQHRYQYFACHSWLLDSTLRNLLPQNSKILQFQKLFHIVNSEKSDEILRYTFKWNTTRGNLKTSPCTSSFAQKVKEHVLGGNDFYEGYGVISKSRK